MWSFSNLSRDGVSRNCFPRDGLSGGGMSRVLVNDKLEMVSPEIVCPEFW